MNNYGYVYHYGGSADHCSIGSREHHKAGGTGRVEWCENVKDVALYIEKIQEMIQRKHVLLG